MQLTKEKEMQDASTDIHRKHFLYRRILIKYIPFIQILNKKKRLQKFFKEAIEEKKRFELELKHNDEFEDRALEACREAKDRIRKIHKSLALKEREEKARRLEIIGPTMLSET